MKIKMYVPIILSLFAFNTFAGQDRGGGNVVICRNGEKIESIELLDYYEGRTRRNFTIDLGAPGMSVDAIIDIALDRLAKLMPSKAENYRYKAKSFISNSRFYKNIKLTGIEDSRHLFLPVNCVLEQAAVQIDPVFEEDKTYNINQDIWDQLSNINKAGLILHEIIYSEARSNGAKDSSVSRRLNGLLATKQIEGINLFSFYNSLKEQIRGAVLFRGMEIYPFRFYENGVIEQGQLSDPSKKIEIHPGDEEPRYLFSTGNISFYSNGSIKNVEARNEQKIQVSAKNPLMVFVDQGGLMNNLSFHANGTLRFARLASDRNHFLSTPNGLVEFFCEYNDVYFNESGDYLHGCKLVADTQLAVNADSMIFGKYKLEYHPNGHIKTGVITQPAKYTGGNYVANILPVDWIPLTFSEMGYLKEGRVDSYEIGNSSYGLSQVETDENDYLLNGYLYNDVSIKKENQTIRMFYGSKLAFQKNGKLRMACLNKPITIIFRNVKYKNIMELSFDENENINSVSTIKSNCTFND